jgi:hypothetical protein
MTTYNATETRHEVILVLIEKWAEWSTVDVHHSPRGLVHTMKFKTQEPNHSQSDQSCKYNKSCTCPVLLARPRQNLKLNLDTLIHVLADRSY